MNRYWNTAINSQTRGLCLRDGVRVPVQVGVESVSMISMNKEITMTKDFIAHEPGGSDG